MTCLLLSIQTPDESNESNIYDIEYKDISEDSDESIDHLLNVKVVVLTSLILVNLIYY